MAEGTLRAAARAVADEMGIGVHAVVGDFHEHLDEIPDSTGRGWWRSSAARSATSRPPTGRGSWARSAGLLGPADRFLLATDLVKPVDRLVAAYDDAAGVTAAFNRNLLAVLNRELGADFDLDRFEHVAVWDADDALDRDAPAGDRGDDGHAARRST